MRKKAIPALLVAIGVLCGYFAKIVVDLNGPERYAIHVSGIEVSGHLSDLQQLDLEKITAEVKAADHENPILSIRFISDSHVEVMTGVVRGPLDGGGNIYELEKSNGQWERLNKDSHGSWVS